MGWLSSILRALAPIAVEHGGQVLRDSLKARAGQSPGQTQAAAPDAIQQLASDVDQLKTYALQLKSDLDILNAAVAAREDRLGVSISARRSLRRSPRQALSDNHPPVRIRPGDCLRSCRRSSTQRLDVHSAVDYPNVLYYKAVWTKPHLSLPWLCLLCLISL